MLNAYRPIAFLLSLPKVLEKVVAQQWTTHLVMFAAYQHKRAISHPATMRPAYKTLMVGYTVLLTAGITLYGPGIWMAIEMSSSSSSVYDQSFGHRITGNFSSQFRTLATGGNCSHSATNASFPELSDVNSSDWRMYRAFSSRNVSSAINVELLSPSAREAVAKEVGLDFQVAARMFKLYHSYTKSFNRCHYRLLSDPAPCSGDAAVTAVIVVHSLPASTQRRMDIRARLLQNHMTDYRLVFLLGWSQSMQSDADAQKEAARYGDIIWADFFEDYDNLTIKTLVMFRWTERKCLTAKYLVKVDDDVSLNMSNLNAVLTSNVNRTRIILGKIGNGEGVYRQTDDKSYMPTYMFSNHTYPPFAHGPSYVISTDLLADLNRAAMKINYLHLEDIFVAACASTLANVHHVHVPSFISTSCSVSDAVAVHGIVCP